MQLMLLMKKRGQDEAWAGRGGAGRGGVGLHSRLAKLCQAMRV